ncbi:MAG: hypothetical protein IJ479_03935 [Alphaproteobacteria bacterium]|nr:hypothetical protein [Alphaproteobacteria bacterium]
MTVIQSTNTKKEDVKTRGWLNILNQKSRDDNYWQRNFALLLLLSLLLLQFWKAGAEISSRHSLRHRAHKPQNTLKTAVDGS